MDGAQLTGATSSYARKYALNALFAIDDSKDSDVTNKHKTDNSSVISEALSEILSPRDQTQFGYDRFIDNLRKLMKETSLIMNNVKAVNSEQQAKDNDLRAKYSAMKMMLESIKK